MGVEGLWKILKPTSTEIKIEELKNQRLAIDTSIWLNQIIKGINTQEEEEEVLYLRTFFNRICKLLYFGIRPVFVFDGKTPLIKKQTILRRRSGREKEERKVKEIAKKIITTKLKGLAIENVLFFFF
jgi:DNA excision repair protein ERCC-5